MGLNCLIISANQVVSPYPVYPLGAAHLAGAMEDAGHQVAHFDILSSGNPNSLSELLKSDKFDLVALSIRNLDTTDSSVPITFTHHAVEIMETIRQNCNCPVVVGGTAFSIMPEKIFSMLQPDYGVVGEGEYLLPWLADSLAAGKTPAKGIFKNEQRDCPWRPVSYAQAITDHYVKWGGMLNVQTKRGCPYKCSYCTYPVLEGKKLRYKDPSEVAAEVRRLTVDYGAKYIFFADAVFNDPGHHFLQVSEALIRDSNKTPWCGFFRPEKLSRQDISLMKRAGLSAMEMGTDAASEATLAGLNKGFSFDDVLKSNDAAHAEEVPVAHFIIFGGPGENQQTFSEGLANIEKLTRSVVFGFIGIRILPGTLIYNKAVAEGVCLSDDDLLEPVFYYSPEISHNEIDKTLRDSWQGRFDRIYPWAGMESQISRMHQKGHVGPMWDFLLNR